MSSFILVGGVILVAVVCVGYLAYRMIGGSSDAVAISDVSEIQKAKMEFLSQQQSGAVPVEQSVNYQETAVLKDQIMALEDENSKLRNELTILQKEKGDLLSTKEKLKESSEIIHELKESNEKLKGDIMEQTRKCSDLTNDIERISAELESSSGQDTLAVEIWEKEIADLKAEKEQLLSARAELDELKRTNLALEDEETKLASKYKRLVERFALLRRSAVEQKEEHNSAIEKIKYENELLAGKVKITEERSKQLEDELQEMKHKTGKAFGLENLEEVLDQQKAILEQSRQNMEGRSETIKVLSEIESERDKLLEQNIVLQRNYDKLKDLNDHLVEKEKILQYELTKSRAQSLGLEKVCEGLTEQIDSLNL